MLRQLVIQNIALIDEVEIELGRGLNVLTGETGAGKSIIIDSINAILGERMSREMIRTGRDKATVQAIFQIEGNDMNALLEEQGITPEEDGTLIITREFTLSGKNTCRINGRIVTVSALKGIGEKLIDIHGQHDNQSLLKTEKHIQLLDCFAGRQLEILKQEYSQLLEKYKEIKSELKNLTGDEGERQRKLDIMRYQVDEIKKAKLKPGEEEELNRQKNLLANSEKIFTSLSSAYEMLFDGAGRELSALDIINRASSELSSIAKWDCKYDEFAKRLDDITYQLEDLINDVRKERDGIEFNPDLLEQIEERLDLIYKLKRKYGADIEEVLEYCRKTEIEIERLEKSEETICSLQKQLEELDAALYAKACEISRERRKAAEVIEERITEQLDELEMKRARFKVNIEFDDSCGGTFGRNYTQNGLDRVEFLISPNPGEPLKPLARIASGGEMSRIMLAIKTILADVDDIPTVIFDEIDIGISGKAAQKVAEKLSFISADRQSICVTHSAQIACMADNHFLIEKNTCGESTNTRVIKLDKIQIIEEIARMLGGGNITGITRKHAEEMIKNANYIKSKRKIALNKAE